MFKKLLAAGLGLAMTVSMMTGCSLVSDGSSSSDTKTEESAAADSSEDSSEADSTADASKEESEDAGSGDLIEKKMALFMTHMSNEFTVTLSNAAKDEAAERGYALNIYDANQDAQNDSMAVGAAKAIADAQKTGEIKVYGIDATSEGLQAVLDGKLQGTMAQGTADQGKFAADACVDLLDGKEVDSETIVDNVYYTADNAQEALDAIAK